MQISPEKRYSDDFETYDSIDMEVRVETKQWLSGLCVCGWVFLGGGAICQKQLSV